ncbi:MAG: hypothetical protein Q9M23_03170, partial [Mariprofundaceae bacterium]|nr:hypothetical protein [Mariprofundaceae bacterium]
RIEGKLTKARGRGLTAWRVDHHVQIEEAVWIEDRHPNQFGGGTPSGSKQPGTKQTGVTQTGSKQTGVNP